MDSYDNDWLFLDDDLFAIWVDEYLSECREIDKLQQQAEGDEE